VLATFVPVATATAGASGTPIATADIALGAAAAPLGVAADGDYVWITDLAENQVIQISERTGTVVARIDVGFHRRRFPSSTT
jgi:DNA-binding beta-propeller fold protein YncE